MTIATTATRLAVSPEPGRLLTIEEAAARLNLSPNTLYSWHSQGIHLEFVRLGRRVMVDSAALEAFIDRNRTVPLDPGERGRNGREQ